MFRFFCLVLLSSTFLFVSLPTHHPPRQHSIVQIKVLFIWVVSRRQDSKCGNHPNIVNYISYNSRVIIPPFLLSVETVQQRGVLSEKRFVDCRATSAKCRQKPSARRALWLRVRLLVYNKFECSNIPSLRSVPASCCIVGDLLLL